MREHNYLIITSVIINSLMMMITETITKYSCRES